jgi:hypothetical protein
VRRGTAGADDRQAAAAGLHRRGEISRRLAPGGADGGAQLRLDRQGHAARQAESPHHDEQHKDGRPAAQEDDCAIPDEGIGLPATKPPRQARDAVADDAGADAGVQECENTSKSTSRTSNARNACSS